MSDHYELFVRLHEISQQKTEQERRERYEYDAQTWREVERMLRLALPSGTRLERASLTEDFGGVDATWIANHRCPIQVRCRHDRPAYAADTDVTFRITEPAMIDAGTYAPLVLFAWLVDGYAEAGKVVDVYQMASKIDPSLGDRRVQGSQRNGRFHVVLVEELVRAKALLAQGGRDRWAPARLGGDRDIARILANFEVK